MLSMLRSFAVRFKEPSSWAGLAVLAGAVGLNVDAGLLQSVTLIGAGAAGLLAFFIPEKSA